MALLSVPLVSLVAVWAVAAVDAAEEVMGITDVKAMNKTFGRPLDGLMATMQSERRDALLYLADPRHRGALDDLRRAQDSTDRSREVLLAAARNPDDRSMLNSGQRRRLDSLKTELNGLDGLRQQVSSREMTRAKAFDGYSRIIDGGFLLFADLNAGINDKLAKHIRTIVSVSRAQDAVTREDALASAALASGRMSGPEFRYLSDAVAEQRVLLRIHVPELPLPADRKAYRDFTASANGRALHDMEESLISAGAGGAPRAVDAERWTSTLAAAGKDLTRIKMASVGRFTDRSQAYEDRTNIYAAAVIVLGLIAVLASLVISFRIGRNLVRDLTRLRKAALELSGNRLPRVMRRLASGEELDVEAEIPPIAFREGHDEVSQVGQAFNDVQRAAVEAAVKQAEMRRGVSEVFVNLARRSQVLLHRQLTLLDTMERRTEDAEELADLFRLDHMTTRMRRHAEGLVILSGVAPARAWRNPVMLINVVRAAVAEVEDYERVEVRRMPRVALTGGAVADITHLVAELVENATVFSPPHTHVQVHGEQVANGFVLEVDDRGLGMPATTLLEANQRLAETPEFELSDTDRLGLFVVSRLAQRHGVRVSLRQSPYGGTTAVVLIPNSLLTESPSSSTTAERRAPGAAGEADYDEDEGFDEAPAMRTRAAFREWGLGPVDAPAEAAPVPTARQEQREVQPVSAQAREDGPGERTADRTPGGLPRRRRSPVLVADRGRTVEGAPPARSESRHARTEPAPDHGQASASADPALPSARPGAGSNEYGLPRRVRQANLAPQLRAAQAEAAAAAQEAPPARERSADEVRSRMASFQRGWQRGRNATEDTEDAEGGPHGDRADSTDGPGVTSPRSSTERDGR
ncbi:histidine kinase [Wenjunlia tyrosinilytica]|uniref:histidine kinase n=1 Tax=Wenjunlia tyrosinilytica TaxID=1544741 RepID=A0A917ZXE9_9ACTN|nr:histidine kinase [Wenjunlia tyrosinilytica]